MNSKNRLTYMIGLAAGLLFLLALSAVLSNGEHFRTVAIFVGGFVVGWIAAFTRFILVEGVK